MPDIRFYLDENFPGAVAAALRQRGIDVVTVAELKLRGSSDEDHLQRAHSDGRVLASRDRDFITLSYTAWPHSGVVYCPMRNLCAASS
ncbi:hypothetical protein DYH09_28950 [bacterium CPR1]|nr:hypothetical protein [bacterium CPR1]